MATTKVPISILEAIPAASNFPSYSAVAGTNFPVPGLDFDASTEETCYFLLPILSYGSGNLTLRFDWYADSASSGDIIWGAALAAITPNTDSGDIETKAFATAQTVTDTHLGTTGQRLHSVDLTISNLDSVADADFIVLKVYRDADAGGDTMTGDARLVGLVLTYSDT